MLSLLMLEGFKRYFKLNLESYIPGTDDNETTKPQPDIISLIYLLFSLNWTTGKIHNVVMHVSTYSEITSQHNS